MAHRCVHHLVVSLTLLALTACMTPAPAATDSSVPLGIDLGASTRVPAAMVVADASLVLRQAGEDRGRRAASAGNIQLAHGGREDAHGVGVVNSVDPAQHKINLTHDPIPSIGWPSMTMDFSVVPSVDLSTVKPGSRINFTIEKGKGGMYEVQSLQPAAARR